MITFEEALNIAKDNKEIINHFTEYNDSYVFSDASDKSFGGTSPVVIDKNSGKALMYVWAIGEGLLDGEVIKEGSID